jgi:hypothetical protein
MRSTPGFVQECRPLPAPVVSTRVQADPAIASVSARVVNRFTPRRSLRVAGSPP